MVYRSLTGFRSGTSFTEQALLLIFNYRCTGCLVEYGLRVFFQYILDVSGK